ncbi:MAG: hypothetical protein ACAI44_29860 [Candidatus Sericytochromatia bacterium]
MLSRIKQQAWLQPWMPRLRLWRRRWDELRHSPALWQEERASRSWAARHFSQADLVEDALRQVERQGGYFGGWALSRSALRTLCACLFTRTRPLIVEWGSGQSTLFWSFLQPLLPFGFIGIEHDPYWYRQLSQRVALAGDFQYRLAGLKQLSAAEWASLWQAPEQAFRLYPDMGSPVAESEYANTRLANGFYAVDCGELFEPGSIDAIVLDGPNGNGRALAFALLYPFLKPDAWILIDDYDHYPFLEQLGRLYAYSLEHVQIQAGKRWCLVRLQGPLSKGLSEQGAEAPLSD